MIRVAMSVLPLSAIVHGNSPSTVLSSDLRYPGVKDNVELLIVLLLVFRLFSSSGLFG